MNDRADFVWAGRVLESEPAPATRARKPPPPSLARAVSKGVRLLKGAQRADGSWEGDAVGPVYGTAVASLILHLPYAYVPIYQR